MSAWPSLLAAATRPFPEVLFVCVHSAAPAQIAAALLTHHSSGRVPAAVAGPDPGAAFPHAPVLDELGLDPAAHPAQPLERALLHPPEFAVTMDPGDTCVIATAGTHLSWQTGDLTGATLGQARRIRDDIDVNVQLLLARMLLDRL